MSNGVSSVSSDDDDFSENDDAGIQSQRSPNTDLDSIQYLSLSTQALSARSNLFGNVFRLPRADGKRSSERPWGSKPQVGDKLCRHNRVALLTIFAISLLTLRTVWHYPMTYSVYPSGDDLSLSVLPSDQRKRKNWAVFYNIYIAPSVPEESASNVSMQELSLSIIEDQLQQVGMSYAASLDNLSVYYYTIGAELDLKWMYDLCTVRFNITCTRMGHFLHGFEDKTLNALKQYCHENADDSVIYLHNKGSYHPGKIMQTNWRRSVTAASTSKLCLDGHSRDSEQCNVCGLLFQPLPAPHFPGNMWTAKCSYVNQLLSPEQYHVNRQKVDSWVESEKSNGTFSGVLFSLTSHFTGHDRYESEHWVGSHPSLVPCDVSQKPNLKYWINPTKKHLLDGLKMFQRSFDHFKFSLAPRHQIDDDWIWYSYAQVTDLILDKYPKNKDLDNLRMYDYFLLRGLLARWHIMYNQLPNTTITPSNKWIWSWFPDGEKWRLGVEQHGPNAIYEVVKDIHLPAFNATTYVNQYVHTSKRWKRRWRAIAKPFKEFKKTPTN